jgi:hypothetical protein
MNTLEACHKRMAEISDEITAADRAVVLAQQLQPGSLKAQPPSTTEQRDAKRKRC